MSKVFLQETRFDKMVKQRFSKIVKLKKSHIVSSVFLGIILSLLILRAFLAKEYFVSHAYPNALTVPQSSKTKSNFLTIPSLEACSECSKKEVQTDQEIYCDDCLQGGL